MTHTIATYHADDAVAAILDAKGRPSVPIEHYLAVGRALKDLRNGANGTKAFNKSVADHFPSALSLRSCDRSNCIRLVEALEGERDADLLEVLGVNDLSEYPTSHPTVIVRHYRRKKREVASQA